MISKYSIAGSRRIGEVGDLDFIETSSWDFIPTLYTADFAPPPLSSSHSVHELRQSAFSKRYHFNRSDLSKNSMVGNVLMGTCDDGLKKKIYSPFIF
jgi:hypothetical protein